MQNCGFCYVYIFTGVPAQALPLQSFSLQPHAPSQKCPRESHCGGTARVLSQCAVAHIYWPLFLELSIEHAEITENCPWKTMILYWKMADYSAIRGISHSGCPSWAWCDLLIKTADFPTKTTDFHIKTTNFPTKTTNVPITTTNFPLKRLLFARTCQLASRTPRLEGSGLRSTWATRPSTRAPTAAAVRLAAQVGTGTRGTLPIWSRHSSTWPLRDGPGTKARITCKVGPQAISTLAMFHHTCNVSGFSHCLW